MNNISNKAKMQLVKSLVKDDFDHANFIYELDKGVSKKHRRISIGMQIAIIVGATTGVFLTHDNLSFVFMAISLVMMIAETCNIFLLSTKNSKAIQFTNKFTEYNTDLYYLLSYCYLIKKQKQANNILLEKNTPLDKKTSEIISQIINDSLLCVIQTIKKYPKDYDFIRFNMPREIENAFFNDQISIDNKTVKKHEPSKAQAGLDKNEQKLTVKISSLHKRMGEILQLAQANKNSQSINNLQLSKNYDEARSVATKFVENSVRAVSMEEKFFGSKSDDVALWTKFLLDQVTFLAMFGDLERIKNDFNDTHNFVKNALDNKDTSLNSLYSKGYIYNLYSLSKTNDKAIESILNNTLVNANSDSRQF